MHEVDTRKLYKDLEENAVLSQNQSLTNMTKKKAERALLSAYPWSTGRGKFGPQLLSRDLNYRSTIKAKTERTLEANCLSRL
jgi:hypothetical protein